MAVRVKLLVAANRLESLLLLSCSLKREPQCRHLTISAELNFLAKNAHEMTESRIFSGALKLKPSGIESFCIIISSRLVWGFSFCYRRKYMRNNWRRSNRYLRALSRSLFSLLQRERWKLKKWLNFNLILFFSSRIPSSSSERFPSLVQRWKGSQAREGALLSPLYYKLIEWKIF